MYSKYKQVYSFKTTGLKITMIKANYSFKRDWLNQITEISVRVIVIVIVIKFLNL